MTLRYGTSHGRSSNREQSAPLRRRFFPLAARACEPEAVLVLAARLEAWVSR
jgi:hypothetical protein